MAGEELIEHLSGSPVFLFLVQFKALQVVTGSILIYCTFLTKDSKGDKEKYDGCDALSQIDHMDGINLIKVRIFQAALLALLLFN